MDIYFKDIKYNAKIEIKTFAPLIKTAKQGEMVKMGKVLTVKGLCYALDIESFVEMDEKGEITLTLKWEDGEEQHSQQIAIEKEESHLVANTYVYYFLSDSHKSRKLFYVKDTFKSRFEFKHRYETQTWNLNRRESERLSRNPYRENGKRYYKGNITPYGRKCIKYESKRIEAVANAYKEATDIEKELIGKLKKLIGEISK